MDVAAKSELTSNGAIFFGDTACGLCATLLFMPALDEGVWPTDFKEAFFDGIVTGAAVAAFDKEEDWLLLCGEGEALYKGLLPSWLLWRRGGLASFSSKERGVRVGIEVSRKDLGTIMVMIAP